MAQSSHGDRGPAKKKLKMNFLMPYLDGLADCGLKLSGYLDCSNRWAEIRSTNGTASDHIQELFMAWMDSRSEDAPCTWEFLIDTVRKLDKEDLADKIERDVFGEVIQVSVEETRGAGPTGGKLPSHSPPSAKEALQQTPALQDMCKLVGRHMAADWRQFGTYLGVQSSAMKKLLKENPHSVDDCFSHLAENWLERIENYGDSPRTWDTVLSATRDSGHTSLSIEVKEKLLKRK